VKVGELCLVAILFAVPLWLVLRAWSRYFAAGCSSAGEIFQMKTGLVFISIATSMWRAAFVLMILEDHRATAKSIATRMSPSILAFVNILLGLGGLVCSRLNRKSAQVTVPLRRAIGFSSGFLIVIWLFLLANPH
jgi:hypothetical protein